MSYKKKIENSTISAYKKTGVLIRTTNDLSKDISADYTVPANYLRNDIVIDIFNDTDSGVVLSTMTRNIKHAYKQDVNSFDFHNIKEEDDPKLFDRPNNIKDLKSIKNLKNKMLELEHRRKGISPDVDKQGNILKKHVKEKSVYKGKSTGFVLSKIFKLPYKGLSSLPHNEVQIDLKPQDVKGIYINFFSEKSILKAFEHEKILGNECDYFSYNKSKGLIFIRDMPLFKQLNVSLLNQIESKFSKFIDSPKFNSNEISLLLNLNELFEIENIQALAATDALSKKIIEFSALQNELIATAAKAANMPSHQYKSLPDLLEHLSFLEEPQSSHSLPNKNESTLSIEIIKQHIIDTINIIENNPNDLDIINRSLQQKTGLLKEGKDINHSFETKNQITNNQPSIMENITKEEYESIKDYITNNLGQLPNEKLSNLAEEAEIIDFKPSEIIDHIVLIAKYYGSKQIINIEVPLAEFQSYIEASKQQNEIRLGR